MAHVRWRPMAMSGFLRANLSASSSHQRSKLCSFWLNRKHQKLSLLTVTKRKNHHSLIMKSALDNRKSSISDKTEKLEEIGREFHCPQVAVLRLDLGILEFDLQAALAALKKKEQHLQDEERKLLMEHTQQNQAKEDLVRREEEIVASCSKHEKLEEELKLANLDLASQSTQIDDLKFQIEGKVEQISAVQSVLALKGDELNKMRNELMKKSQEAITTELELESKAQLLDEANEIVKKQEVELLQLQKAIQEKEEGLEVSAIVRKREDEKLKASEANLEKQTTEWLFAQEDLKKLAEEASKRIEKENKTMEDFRRVEKLLVVVRSELVSSQKVLACSKQKLEDQEQLAHKQLIDLQEQWKSIMSYMTCLKDTQREVESERLNLKIAESQKKELERDLFMEKALINQLQGDLDKERSSLEQAVQEKCFLEQELNRESTKLEEMHVLLQIKEFELVEARLEIQNLKSERASLQLVLEEKDLELFHTRKKSEAVNEEIAELRTLVNSGEDQLMEATRMLKEKEEQVQTMQHTLNDTKLKFYEAKNGVERIVGLTNKLVISAEEDYEGLNTYNDMESKILSPLAEKPTDTNWRKKQLETELVSTRESLRAKEIEVVAAERAFISKDDELKMVLGRLDTRETEIMKMKEQMNNDANDLRELYALSQERISERSVTDLAIEKFETKAVQLEVEAATSALQKLAEICREVLFYKTSLSVESDCDTEDFLHIGSGAKVCVVNNENFSEFQTKVARLSALADRLVKEACIVGDVN